MREVIFCAEVLCWDSFLAGVGDFIQESFFEVSVIGDIFWEGFGFIGYSVEVFVIDVCNLVVMVVSEVGDGGGDLGFGAVYFLCDFVC